MQGAGNACVEHFFFFLLRLLISLDDKRLFYKGSKSIQKRLWQKKKVKNRATLTRLETSP